MRKAYLVFACAVLLAALPAPARAAVPPNGMLAAVVDSRLVTVNGDGSGLRTLATGDISGLAWSPDGNRLAYSIGGKLVVMDVASARTTTLTTGTDPTWGPEGRLGFRRGEARVILAPDGSESTPLGLDALTTVFAWAPNLIDYAAVVGPLLITTKGLSLPVSGVQALAWTRDGSGLAYADASGLHVGGDPVVVAGTVVSPALGARRQRVRVLHRPRVAHVPRRGHPAHRAQRHRGHLRPTGSRARSASPSPVIRSRPPRCTTTAQSATTQSDQSVDLPPWPCSDPAGRLLTQVVVKAPEHGTLVGSRYTPAAGFTGQDGVTYKLTNGVGESENVRVTIFVVPRPAAVLPPPLIVVARAPFLSARAKPRLDSQAHDAGAPLCDQDCRVRDPADGAAALQEDAQGQPGQALAGQRTRARAATAAPEEADGQTEDRVDHRHRPQRRGPVAVGQAAGLAPR